MATFNLLQSPEGGTVKALLERAPAAPAAGAAAVAAPPAGGATTPTTPTTGQSDAPSAAHWWISIPAIVIVVIAAAAALHWSHDPNYKIPGSGAKPIAGLSLFALFFVAALALERFLEPIAALVPSVDQAANDFGAKKAAAAKAVAKAHQTHAQTDLDDAQKTLDDAATALATVDRHKGDRVIALWTIATVLGIVGAAALKLYFLRVVGIAHVPRGLEIAATGLIIGAGTKPLHDLVSSLQDSKDTAKAAATAAT